MVTPEGKLRDYMLKLCGKHNIRAYKISFENRRGAPDWLLIGNGVHIFVELKAPKGVLSHAQIVTQHDLTFEGGCDVWVCRTKEDVDEIIGDFLP